MVLYQRLRCSQILKKEVPQRRWLVKNQSSATWWGWKGVIKNVRLKISQQNTRLGMRQVRGFTALLKDMSNILWFDKTKVTVLRALFGAFLGYPGLPLGRPDPAQTPWHPGRPNQPEPTCEAWKKEIVNSNITLIQPITLVIHYSHPNEAFKLVQGCKLQEPSKYPWGLHYSKHGISCPIITIYQQYR